MQIARYGPVAQALRWLIAAMIFVMLGLGYYMEDLPLGTRKLELTIPGAGTLVLQGSNEPGQLIELCRRLSAPGVKAQPTVSLPPA